MSICDPNKIISDDSPQKIIQNDFELGDYERLKAVGKGGSSTVYKGLLKKTGAVVAIKQIDTEGFSSDQILNIKSEIDTIKTLAHEHIVCYLGTLKISNPSKILMFLEYADRGSLRQFYQRKGALSEPQAANCTRQILAGLQYLHGNGIAHRDIKCANCLLTKEGIVKLADFGASKRFETDSVLSGLKGTPHWMAPEVIKGTQMTAGWLKADVWSVGCTVVEMITAKFPFSEYENPMTAMYKIANGEQPPLPADVSCGASEVLKEFIGACCALDPEERPDAKDLLNKAFPSRNKSKKKGGTVGANSPTARAFNSPVSKAPASVDDSLVVMKNHPTLTSTPSEALTETCMNPLTRDNSLAMNMPTHVQEQQQVPPRQGGVACVVGDAPFQASSTVALGNGIGLISVDGVTTKDCSSGSKTQLLTQGDLTNVKVSDVNNPGTDAEDEDEDETDELYLDDFEEGEVEDTETSVERKQRKQQPQFGPLAGNDPVISTEEGEYSFADMIAADEALKKGQVDVNPGITGDHGDGRVEYIPLKQTGTGNARRRPDNRPSRGRANGANTTAGPPALSVPAGDGSKSIDTSTPTSATLRAGHGRSLPFPASDVGIDCTAEVGQSGDVSDHTLSEIDSQLALTRSIVSKVGLPEKAQGDILRSSIGSVGSLDTVSMKHSTMRPSPSSEVYLEQPAAPVGSISPMIGHGNGHTMVADGYAASHIIPQRPQAPIPGDMPQVLGVYEHKEIDLAGQCNLRNSTSSVRSSVSTPGSAGSGGSGTHGGLVVDSELLSRASISGSASVRREALEALGSGASGDMPRFDQHQDFLARPRHMGGAGRRGNKPGNKGPASRSQSANAAGQVSSAYGAGSMRLPPMSAMLNPLNVGEPDSQDSRGVGIAVQGADPATTIIGIGPAQARMTLGGSTNMGVSINGSISGSVIGNPNVPSNYAARSIHSAPSVVGRGPLGLAKLNDENTLPPLQSLTPKIKDSKRRSQGLRSELHQSK